MFKTFFRNIPLKSFSYYGKFFHKSEIIKEHHNVINSKSLSDLEDISKIPNDPLPKEIVQKEKTNMNEELLKQFPNKITKEQMDELLTNSAIIRKYFSVY